MRIGRFNINFCWALPKKSEILIFDVQGSKEIEKYVIKQICNSYIYDSNKIKLYFNIFFSVRYIKNILTTSYMGFSLKRRLYITYLKTELEFINPKIIITYNDDNILYHNLANVLKGVEFIAIQNGLREKFIRERVKHTINHKYLYCFGYNDEKKNLSSNWHVKDLRPIGSLRAGIALSKFKSDNKLYDICLISEYEPREKNDPDNHHWNDHWLKVSEILSEILINKNYRIIVALSGRGGSREKEYFKYLYSRSMSTQHIRFTDINTHLDSYRAILESNVTIGFCSTLLAESIALKSKALQINTSTDNTYFDFDKSFIHMYSKNSELEKKIDELVSIPYDAYYEDIKDYIPQYMNIDINNLPQNKIHQDIKNILYNKR